MLCGPINRRRKRLQNMENEEPVSCFHMTNKKGGRSGISPLKKLKGTKNLCEMSVNQEKNVLVDSQVHESGFVDQSSQQVLKKGVSSSQTVDSGLGDQMSQISSNLSQDDSKKYSRAAYLSKESGFNTMESIKDHLDSYYSVHSMATDSMNQAMLADSSVSVAPTDPLYERITRNSRRIPAGNASVTRERFLDETSEAPSSSVYGTQSSYSESSQLYVPKHPLFGKGKYCYC